MGSDSTHRFGSFVIFGDMRTGSNFLEANLNAFDGLACHGEAFNPHFIGYPKRTEVLGVSLAQRDQNPICLLDRIRLGMPGEISGFRFFNDHDPRVFDAVLYDPNIAKIILTRNPLESYVSLKIARQTGQWKLTDVTRRKEARVQFDGVEFERHLETVQGFQRRIQRGLQTSGQAAFHIAYDDLQDIAVVNGLAQWLGAGGKQQKLATALKPQNPQPIAHKVSNPEKMQESLWRLDRLNSSKSPNFEAVRGPVVPSYLAGPETPLLFMPIRSGPERVVRQWLAGLDCVNSDALKADFSQNSLREWKRDNPGYRSFTVIRHPLARAYHAFCTKIVSTGPGSFLAIRRTLQRTHNLVLPDEDTDRPYDLESHRAAFTTFLQFLKANLSGQTAIRVDAHWASQSQVLQGMAEFALPDMIVRETEMAGYLPALALQVGHVDPADPQISHAAKMAPFALSDIYEDSLERRAQEVYARDYLMFGFEDWTTTAKAQT